MNQNQELSPSQRMLLAIKEAKAKLEAAERAKTEPIAVIGMSCRFPGHANTPEAYWELLRNGVDAVTEIPSDRWNVDDYYSPDPEHPGTMYTKYGSFLAEVDQFDPQFFSISPREAQSLDPQQRILLEVSWEALENAGQIPERLEGSLTGVFVGITTNDYIRLASSPTQIDSYFSTGNALNASAGRLSYTFGFTGPAMAIDTACSSSLVAVHEACQSLRNQECNLALAGGVNLILAPENSVALSKAKMLSPTGRCRTFDAGADGIVRGEGCGVLILKRLQDAVADRDPILALIRGSVVNQDGASSGLTVPNKMAQENLIAQALTRAKLKPSQVSYLEAHGTGTSLGDPIELRALSAALGKERTSENPLLVGSVKTNIGHLESAAGMAGLMKTILAMQHREIPPHLHFQTPSTYFNWDGLIKVPAEATPWLTQDEPRIAGVSSFGASGTNAHVILEEAPPQSQETEPDAEAPLERPLHLFNISAKSQAALVDLAHRYRDYLQHSTASIGDLCYSVNNYRQSFNYRLSALASSTAQLQEKLAAFVANSEVSGVFHQEVTSTTPPKVAFLFTGQGSQYPGMGEQLYQTQPSFRAAFKQCAQLFDPELDPTLLSVLYGENTALLNQTLYTQPALFTLEYALAQLWLNWGINPSVVIGHSVGEYVAATIAGVFSLEDAVKLLAARARGIQALPEGGGLVALLASAAVTADLIAPYASQVSIAAYNAPNSTVISGANEALAAIIQQLEQRGLKHKRLSVSHAFHSPLMSPMLADFRRVAESISYHPPEIDFISNLTGELNPSGVTTPQYWVDHVSEAVNFVAGMKTLEQQSCQCFLEIGAQPTLLGLARRCLSSAEGFWLPSLRPTGGEWEQMLASVAQLFVAGVGVDWLAFEEESSRRRVSLPTYPFQRQRFWLDTLPAASPPPSVRSSTNGNDHPLLQQKLPLAELEAIYFQGQLSSQHPYYLQDHRVYDRDVLPATAYLEMMLAAASRIFRSRWLTVTDVAIHHPLILEAELTLVQLILTSEAEATYGVKILSLSAGEDSQAPIWTLHATGKVKRDRSATQPLDLAALQDEHPDPIAVENCYRHYQDYGLEYGDSFQGMQQLWQGQNYSILSRISLPQSLTPDADSYVLHPVLLDSCFQTLGAMFSNDGGSEIYLPLGLDSLTIYHHPDSQLWCRGQIAQKESRENIVADLTLINDDGAVVAVLKGLALKRASRQALLRMMQPSFHDWLYRVDWQPQAAPIPAASASGSWLIFSDDAGIAVELALRLSTQGDRYALVSLGQGYQAVDNGYQIDPLNSDNWHKLWQDFTTHHQDCRGIIYLWSWASIETEKLNLSEIEQAQDLGYVGVLHLVQTLTQAQTTFPRLWLVTQGTQALDQSADVRVQQSPIWGLGRSITLEYPDLPCIRLDLAPSEPEAVTILLQELAAQDQEQQIAYRRGIRHVARLVRHKATHSGINIPSDPSRLVLSEYGVLENLTLQPLTPSKPAPGEVEIEVRAVGLNFRDVLNALGMLAEYNRELGIESADLLPFGGECAGVITAVGANVENLRVGDEVIAAQAIGCLRSYINVPQEFVVAKPRNLSFEEAATIPTAFLTADYALRLQAKLKPGEKILIHSAAGGVGQAAVQIAQQTGAEVFATASTPKWEFLKSQGVQHIMNSRTLDFADKVREITEQAGVDVVLNSLNGDFIPKSLEILTPGGRFVEIGKIGILSDSQIRVLNNSVRYLPFDLLDISTQQPQTIAAVLQQLMPQFEKNQLKPLPSKVFPLENVVDAFRFMAGAKHIGKVVITWSKPEDSSTAMVRPHSTYLITGGLGALGMQVARWLSEQGAEQLVLTSRGEASAAAQAATAELEQAGTKVTTVRADVANPQDVARIVNEINTHLPSLRGIVHAAGVLDDGMLSGQTRSRFQKVMAAKVLGTWNLHQHTQTLPLDFFVCFSAAAALLGSPGQGNYAAANAFMDSLMHHRRSLNLPALSINWGPWADVGMAARLEQQNQAKMDSQGMGSIPLESGLHILGDLLTRNTAQVGVLPMDWKQFPSQFATPFLEHLLAASEASADSGMSFLQKLELTPVSEQRPMLLTFVRAQIAKGLGLSSPEQVGLQQNFTDLGMDSLIAVELSNSLKNSLGCFVPSTLAFDYPTVEALVEYLAESVLNESVEETVPESTPHQELTQPETNLEELSDREAEALLLSKLDSLSL